VAVRSAPLPGATGVAGPDAPVMVTASGPDVAVAVAGAGVGAGPAGCNTTVVNEYGGRLRAKDGPVSDRDVVLMPVLPIP